MCTGVKEDDAAFCGGLEAGEHAIEIQTLCGLREVGIGFDGQVDIAKDLVVVGPGWVAHIDGLGCGVGGAVKFGEEKRAHVHSASAGDGLHGGDALVGDGGRGDTEDQLLGGGGEINEARDGQVFVVEVGVAAEQLVGL